MKIKFLYQYLYYDQKLVLKGIPVPQDRTEVLTMNNKHYKRPKK